MSAGRGGRTGVGWGTGEGAIGNIKNDELFKLFFKLLHSFVVEGFAGRGGSWGLEV